MFRLSSEDAALSRYLPEAKRHTWTVPVDDGTWSVYEQGARELLTELASISMSSAFDLHAYYRGQKKKFDEGTRPGKVMAVHQALEMFLDHPGLVLNSAQKYLDDPAKGSRYAQSFASRFLGERWTCPKLEYLGRKVTALLSNDSAQKILVFSRHPLLLDYAQKMLSGNGWESTKYHGTMSAKAKAAAIARFRDPACRVFLSSHAGAYGTDMPMANWLINYDLPWSFGKAHQINGRHVRASSEFATVHVVNMVMEGTIEERKLAQVTTKGQVSTAVIDGRGADRSGRVGNDVESLRVFLTRH